MNITEHTVADMHPRLIGKTVMVGIYETTDTETDAWVEAVVGVLVLFSDSPVDGGMFIFEGLAQPLNFTKDQTFLISYTTEDK